VEFLFHRKAMVTDELVNLRRAIYRRLGFVQAMRNVLALQDPQARAAFAWDPSWVAKIEAPTLLLWTDHDPTGGLDEARQLRSWIPDARLHVIADSGHWPQWEHPQEFADQHRSFLLDPASHVANEGSAN
jgi:2-hydroxy-6-oxonona-2,4-dienedioate hydrolase